MKLTDFFMDLGKPVSYYPKLTAITGGVKETLLLCQLLYWEGKQQSKDRWIYKSREELTEETGLSRYEQETARRNLKKKGFLEEKLAGIPATMHYRVNLEAVNNAWNDYMEGQNPSLGKYSKQDGEDVPPTSMQKTNQLVCRKPTNWYAENQPTITENTTEITTENTTINTYALNSACDSTQSSPNDHDQQEKPRKPFRTIKQQQRFDAFWEAYPRKRSKGQAEKTWVKLNPDDNLLKEILAGLENAKRSIDWQKDGGQYIPYPSTWLNAKGWEDEYEEAMSNGKTGRSFGKADGEGKKPKSNWGRFAGLIPIRDGGTGEDIGSQDNEDTAANSEAPGSPK